VAASAIIKEMATLNGMGRLSLCCVTGPCACCFTTSQDVGRSFTDSDVSVMSSVASSRDSRTEGSFGEAAPVTAYSTSSLYASEPLASTSRKGDKGTSYRLGKSMDVGSVEKRVEKHGKSKSLLPPVGDDLSPDNYPEAAFELSNQSLFSLDNNTVESNAVSPTGIGVNKIPSPPSLLSPDIRRSTIVVAIIWFMLSFGAPSSTSAVLLTYFLPRNLPFASYAYFDLVLLSYRLPRSCRVLWDFNLDHKALPG
jgi:hypothetical protein